MISQKKITLIALFFLYHAFVFSQCAMCKATLESDLAAGGSAGKGINNGIMYLIAFPYLLLGVVGYFVYKHYKKTRNSDQV